MENEKQRQQSILDGLGLVSRLIWLFLGVARLLRAVSPRRRVWRFVSALRHPLIIGLSVVAVIGAGLTGRLAPHLHELGAGAMAGVAVGLYFWDEL